MWLITTWSTRVARPIRTQHVMLKASHSLARGLKGQRWRGCGVPPKAASEPVWLCCVVLFAHSGPASVVREVWREEGVRGFFRGFTPTLAREVPGYAIFFSTYEFARTTLASHGSPSPSHTHCTWPHTLPAKFPGLSTCTRRQFLSGRTHKHEINIVLVRFFLLYKYKFGLRTNDRDQWFQ